MGSGLTQRAVAAGIVHALVVGVTFGLLLCSMADMRRAQLRAGHSTQVLVAANRLERLTVDMETGLRGFALTGQDRFLEPWRAAVAAYSGQIGELRRLVADDAAQRARAERLAAAGSSYVHDYSMPLVAAAHHEPASVTTTAVAEGKRRVDLMRADFRALVSDEQSEVRAQELRSEAATREARTVGAAGLITSVALIAACTGYLTRVVVAPVRRVAATAGRMARGDLAARVPGGGPGEVGLLERAFNTMADTLARNREELAASRSRIVTAADQARRRIERDLHDGIQQRLVSLALDVRTAQTAVPPGRGELGERLDRLADGLGEAVDELREISRGIHPAVLSRAGLGPALKALARRSPLPVELDLNVPDRLPEPVEVAAYYVVSEALANTAKHARATAATVRAEAREGLLRLEVRDDGAGGAAAGGGSGLIGVTDRVEALGGTLTVTSPPAQGTTLVADLPTTGH
ncbi:HAMP domain-containing protein [Nonomuraea phyllanthi]|uniref:histidine kinase n=1 Tax=Nonomuraea phyllanthi TaxID=2219224 RepID=A0A5C4VZY9_9ACTN|nr:CHASE3 domain-containing protein [Nonomuraea phyllanthi]KAB8190900.1 HAMP domain-containing protein [Nonomuraea phyllanthi]